MSKQTFASEIHHRVIKKFPRRQVYVPGIDNVWSADLMDMKAFMKYNNNFRYALCVIDVFSKYAWCIALKNKDASSVLNAFQSIITSSKRSPQKIWVDKGSEFYNKTFEHWINGLGITMYSTYGESKSVIVERFIRTLKELMNHQFTVRNTREWVKLLPEVMKNYNNHFHSSIGMTPHEASQIKNAPTAYENMYSKSHPTKTKPPKFEVGDPVRISRIKGVFDKGIEPNFSHEVFTIVKVLHTDPITYKLKDYNNDTIEGSFYTQELLKTKTPDYYEVERIIDTRKVGKKKQYFVKFLGWPKKFSMWLNEDDMYDIPTK
jgi:hypothetical protein